MEPSILARFSQGSGPMLRRLQRQRLDMMKKDLGEHGEQWREGWYEGKLYYEVGTPNSFWLHVNTEVIRQLGMFIKVRGLLIRVFLNNRFHLVFQASSHGD